MRGWFALLLVVAALLAPGVSRAQAGVTGLPLRPCVTRISPGDDAITLLEASGRFDCATPQRRFGAGSFWVRADVPVRAGIATRWPARLRFASLWQDRLTIYGRYADGTVARVTLDGRDLTQRLQLGAVVEQGLPARAAPLVRVLWRVDGAANQRGIVLGAAIASPAQSAAANTAMAAIYAGFVGLTLALLFYNLALWVALRHRFQLAYCVMLVALSFYAVTASGALAWLWPEIVNNDRLRLSYLTLAISAAAALEFARSFFEPRVFGGWLGRAATGVALYLVGSAALFALAPGWAIAISNALCIGAYFALLALVPPLLWRAWQQRSNYLWLFAIAWALPVAIAALRLGSFFQLFAWSFWLDNSTVAAMTLEALLSSLAIAYRIRLLSLERDEAREQEIAARLLADSDPLTGLMNRRGFMRAAIGRAGTQRLLIADIDHFKRVNDTLGHDGGDEVLRLVARALRAAAPGALVARLGGEEFAVLADPVSAPTPAALLERVRRERMPFDVAVTVSIGACAGPLASDTDWKTLYRAADRALFDAKAAGRDRARHSASIAA